MRTLNKQFTLIVSITLLAATLACNLPGASSPADSIKKTAEAAAMMAASTIQAINPQDLQKTAQAAITQVAPAAMDILTQVPAEALLKTAQAAAAPGGIPAIPVIPGLLPGGDNAAQAPEDIPLVEPRESYTSTSETTNYVTPTDSKTVVSFYEKEMPNKGWQSAGAPQVAGDTTVLNYQKTGKKATVTITRSGEKTSVTITTQKS